MYLFAVPTGWLMNRSGMFHFYRHYFCYSPINLHHLSLDCQF